MIRSWASRRASSAAACAVASSGYPMAIKSAMAPPFLSICHCPPRGMPWMLLTACRRVLNPSGWPWLRAPAPPAGEGARPAARSGKPAGQTGDTFADDGTNDDRDVPRPFDSADQGVRSPKLHEAPPHGLAEI